VPPIIVSGPIPPGTTDAAVDYTISMPGVMLKRGQAQVSGGQYSFVFDPANLAKDFPNLDLVGRDIPGAPGLADTFTISLLLSGTQHHQHIYRAGSITIQGEQVQYHNALSAPSRGAQRRPR
jgi:hypothetical protein